MDEEFLNKKDDYLAVRITHQRYSFDGDITLWKNKSLREIAERECMNVNRIEPFGDRFILDRFILDESCRNELSKYDGDIYKCKNHIAHIDVDCLMIVPFNNINCENDYFSFCFGETNNKYGLFDLKGEK